MKHDLGLLLARLIVGGSIAAHGAQKAYGTFEGPGPEGTAGFMSSLGFTDGAATAKAAWTTELSAGALIALGALGPAGPAALMSMMAVAMITVHGKNGYFADKNGIELNVLYVAAALALSSAGYGRFSLDAATGLGKIFHPKLTWIAILGAAAGTYAILSQRIPPAPEGSV